MSGRAAALIFSLRPRQWIKNAFVLLPLVFGEKLLSFPENLRALAGALIFSLLAGSVYLLNDVLDREADRAHPTKRLRPVASGALAPGEALAAGLVLAALSLAAGLWLDRGFALCAGAYLAANLLYSKVLKNIVIVDVFCIALFFLLRLAAGAFLAEVSLSHWILFMTGLLALFLGFGKRRQEIEQLKGAAPAQRSVLAKYNLYFIDQMIGVLTPSILLAYMLYTVDPGTVARFETKGLIGTVPFVLFGILRYLYLVHHWHADGDPTQLLLWDWIMQLDVVLWFVICAAVIYRP